MDAVPTKTEKPCRQWLKYGGGCKEADHCANCGRHLDPYGEKCPKGCGNGNEEQDDAANNDE